MLLYLLTLKLNCIKTLISYVPVVQLKSGADNTKIVFIYTVL